MLLVLKYKQKDGNGSVSTEDGGSMPMTRGTQTDQGDPEYITTSPPEDEQMR